MKNCVPTHAIYLIKIKFQCFMDFVLTYASFLYGSPIKHVHFNGYCVEK